MHELLVSNRTHGGIFADFPPRADKVTAETGHVGRAADVDSLAGKKEYKNIKRMQRTQIDVYCGGKAGFT
jgi:hypothetical protein